MILAIAILLSTIVVIAAITYTVYNLTGQHDPEAIDMEYEQSLSSASLVTEIVIPGSGLVYF
jgi:hypothetical protein